MIEQHLGEKVFRQVLRDSVMYVEAVTLGKPITHLTPKSEQAESFKKIGREVPDVELDHRGPRLSVNEVLLIFTVDFS